MSATPEWPSTGCRTSHAQPEISADSVHPDLLACCGLMPFSSAIMLCQRGVLMPDRRTFLKLAASGALSAWLPASIARALEIPAHHRTGSLMDVEHIVVLMQENRSFDHYFGTLRGVRGFGDPRAVRLPNGDPVWYQPAR